MQLVVPELPFDTCYLANLVKTKLFTGMQYQATERPLAYTIAY